jgi:preprotein translocase SecE subunit
MNSFFSYLQNVRSELSHVTFPTRKVLIASTITVVVLSVVTALILTGFDLGFTRGVNFLITR